MIRKLLILIVLCISVTSCMQFSGIEGPPPEAFTKPELVPAIDPTQAVYQLVEGDEPDDMFVKFQQKRTQPVDWKKLLEEEKEKFKWEQQKIDEENMQKTAILGRKCFLVGVFAAVLGFALSLALKQYGFQIVGVVIGVLGVVSTGAGLVFMKVAAHWHAVTTGVVILLGLGLLVTIAREFDVIDMFKDWLKKRKSGKVLKRLDLNVED